MEGVAIGSNMPLLMLPFAGIRFPYRILQVVSSTRVVLNIFGKQPPKHSAQIVMQDYALVVSATKN